jgi:hypothetical protein
MISFIEGPHQDEPVFSLLARLYNGLIGTTRSGFANYLFGDSGLVLPFDLPCALDALTTRVTSRVGLTADDLIAAHTMYPITAFLMSAEKAEGVKQAMRSHGRAAQQRSLWNRQRSADGERPLCFCSMCRQIDVAKHGYTWWRRMHQVPDVFCCAVHGTCLEISQFVPGQFWKLHYPDANDAVSVATTPKPDRLDVGYARAVRWMLNHPPFPIDTDKLQQLYHQRLEQRGLVKGARLRRTEFLEQFFAQRSEHEWAQRHMLFDPHDDSAWPAQTVKAKANHRSFRTHLLVMMFLEIPIAQIQNLLAGVSVVREVARVETVRQMLRRHWFDPSWSRNALQKECGCSAARMLRIAAQEGLPIPRLAPTARLKLFRKERAKRREIFLRGRKNVSAKVWKRTIRWLGRNDARWVEPRIRNLGRAVPKRVDWLARERDYMEKLPRWAAQIRAERPFRRVCASSFISLSPHCRSRKSKFTGKMPRLAAEMKRLTETTDEFTLRRVNVIRKLYPDLPPFAVRERAAVDRRCRNEKVLRAVGYELVGGRWRVPGSSNHPLYGLSPAIGRDAQREEAHAASA